MSLSLYIKNIHIFQILSIVFVQNKKKFNVIEHFKKKNEWKKKSLYLDNHIRGKKKKKKKSLLKMNIKHKNLQKVIYIDFNYKSVRFKWNS